MRFVDILGGLLNLKDLREQKCAVTDAITDVYPKGARDLKEDGPGSVSEQSFYGSGRGQYTADHDTGLFFGLLNAKP